MIDASTSFPDFPQRQLSSDAGQNSPAAFNLGGFLPLPETPSVRAPQAIEDRKGETQRIVKRLLAIIADHHSSAKCIGVALDQKRLLQVIAALEAETRNQPPAPFIADADEVFAYLMQALYEELLEEPSNVLFTTQTGVDSVRYEAMEVKFWQECLAALKHILT
jgi:hypothetical protein